MILIIFFTFVFLFFILLIGRSIFITEKNTKRNTYFGINRMLIILRDNFYPLSKRELWRTFCVDTCDESLLKKVANASAEDMDDISAVAIRIGVEFIPTNLLANKEYYVISEDYPCIFYSNIYGLYLIPYTDSIKKLLDLSNYEEVKDLNESSYKLLKMFSSGMFFTSDCEEYNHEVWVNYTSLTHEFKNGLF